MKIELDLQPESISDIVRQSLLEYVSSPYICETLKEHLRYVISFYSIPKTYMDGKYDIEC